MPFFPEQLGCKFLVQGVLNDLFDLQLQQAIISGGQVKEMVLSMYQLDDTQGILAAMALFFANQPVSGDTITMRGRRLKNGSPYMTLSECARVITADGRELFRGNRPAEEEPLPKITPHLLYVYTRISCH